MHKGRKLIADTFCDVYSLLEPWIDESFWDFASYVPEPGSICLVGRQQAISNVEKLKELCQQDCVVVFANSAEGSSTQMSYLNRLGIEQLVLNGRLLLLTGGRMNNQYPYLLHEHFLVRILAYQENLEQQKRVNEIYQKKNKPYSFLFLNGRGRPHRKYLWHRFNLNGLLKQSLWTMMDSCGTGNRLLRLPVADGDLMNKETPVQLLPSEYEVSRYRNNTIIDNAKKSNHFVKFDLFDNEWGEIYLEAAPYIDTYFSLVTETVLEHPYSFFTEKIAKPLAQGHPWIAATNRGFYQDLHNLGFRTFNKLIDESFDSIDNTQDRMDRIVAVVSDLCQQSLDDFLAASEDVCKYNQQRLREVVDQENQTFPTRFFQFIDRHG